jgi:hypothetical protein
MNKTLTKAQMSQENNRKMLDACTLRQADTQPGPISMYVMGMLSDVQECIRMGNAQLANAICNDIKLIIGERMATKDEHGRHDYSPAERARKGI